jgi:hypothetical protein
MANCKVSGKFSCQPTRAPDWRDKTYGLAGILFIGFDKQLGFCLNTWITGWWLTYPSENY